MAVERIYPYENLHGMLFHVNEQVEIYDGRTAIVLNHLLNHIKVLSIVALMLGTSDLVKQIQPHATHYQLSPNWVQDDSEWKRLARSIAQECAILIEYYYKVLELEGRTRPDTKVELEASVDLLLTEAQSRVPFVDYQYPREGSERDS